jgi:hypothetical protein
VRFEEGGRQACIPRAGEQGIAHWCRHQTADPEAVLSASFGMAPRQRTELGRSRGRSRLFCEGGNVSGSSGEVRRCLAG